MAAETLSKISDCDIDATGDFKYILVEVTDSKKNTKTVVRGNIRGFYHADILEEFESQVSPLKVKCECPGGGRIEHRPQEKYIRVYSYSQGFGRANHQIAVDILKKTYPEYNIVAEKD